MEMHLKPIVKGALTCVPGINGLVSTIGTGGTNSALYCYDVWLKHVTLLWAHGLRSTPATVAELGPGDSLGIGLAAVLSGTDHYFALDVVAHSERDLNLRVFDELLQLFRRRAPRPRKGWPDFDHHLAPDLFPHHALPPQRLDAALSPQRVERVREAILSPAGTSADGSVVVRYVVPWSDPSVVVAGSVDLAISHSVLEHIDDLDSTYAALSRWLKPGGFMSHQIDYSSHGMARHWNGFRQCPEWLWTIVRGRRPYLINREPHSGHMRRIRSGDFDVVCELANRRNSGGIARERLAARWIDLADEDLNCSEAFVQAVKRPGEQRREAP